jgi:hypothetical protein
VLGIAPGAAQWAARFTSSVHLPLVAFRRQAAPAGVHCAVESVAHALIPDPDVISWRLVLPHRDGERRRLTHRLH